MKKNKEFFLSLIFFSILLFLTIGYAVYDKTIDLGGNLTVKKIGKVKIVKIELDPNANNTLPSDAGTMSLDENDNIVLDYSFTLPKNTENYYDATYLITVENGSPYEYKFTGFSLNPNVKVVSGNPETTGATLSYSFDTNNVNNEINLGGIINPGETKTIAITLNFYVASRDGGGIGIDGSGGINASIEDDGEFHAALLNNSADLSNGKTIDCFEVEVLNTYNFRKVFTLSSSNKNFLLVTETGEPLNDLYIDAPDESNPTSNQKTYKACLKVNEGSIFTTNTSQTSIVLKTAGLMDLAIGNLNIAVDISEEKDEIIPQIANVNFRAEKYDSSNSSLITNVTWQRIDTGGSDITNYYVVLYDSTTNSALYTFDTKSSVESCQLILDNNFLTANYNSLVTNNHNFYVKVYGKDMAGNIGSSYCTSTDNNYCVNSNTTSLKYVFNVNTTGFKNMSVADTTKKVYLNNAYSTTIDSTNQDYALPGTITVTMGTTQLTTSQFSYSLNEGSTTQATLSINENVINNDISLSGSATYNGGVCLAAGTKIKLSDGTYKKIEDIRYDDLILAFSYDKGKIVYEYPIWIEAEGKADSYQRTTFSDGTILETVGSHGVFSKDLNKYVSVLDRKNFYIGSNVVKFNKQNKMEIVKVTKIETIHKKISYYHVSSTRYHNVIANDLLTTDAMLVISNMFPFNNDLTWHEERSDFLKTNDLFYYEDWKDYFPSHIFKGFRMEEAKYLYNQGLLDINLFSTLLGRLINEPIKNADNNNMWMITTSDDLANNKKGTLYEEGSYFEVPKPNNNKNFVGWYNTALNKIYFPHDKVEVIYGMYFEALYQD